MERTFTEWINLVNSKVEKYEVVFYNIFEGVRKLKYYKSGHLFVINEPSDKQIKEIIGIDIRDYVKA